jgi:hypothetical protein
MLRKETGEEMYTETAFATTSLLTDVNIALCQSWNTGEEGINI